MANDPAADVMLTPLVGEPRSLRDWLTTFHLATVVLDPYTNESSWVLPTAARVLRAFQGAAARVSFVVTAEGADCTAFLGSLADEFLVFTDPERSFVKSLGLERLPAFAFIRMDGALRACAEGWDPHAWRTVADAIASTTAWSRPNIPAAGDPGKFAGSAALI